MKVIKNHAKMAEGLFKKNICDSTKEYRPIKFLYYLDCDDGLLVYNCLSKELLLLEGEEGTLLNSKRITGDVDEYLVSNYFKVPSDFDEMSLADELRGIAMLFKESKSDVIDYYTVFTTTDCNERCFYCYENGCEKYPMSPDTAKDAAQYILKTGCENHPVTLHWFGGEPLLEKNVISTICNVLKSNDRKFTSIMTSNGYLFDEDTVLMAKNEWNLCKVQITLDGTREVYNERKSYIYENTDAFSVVLSNIERLLKNKISVEVRLNMDAENEGDLEDLLLVLKDRFSGYERFYVYCNILYQYEKDPVLVEKYKKLYQKIYDSGLLLNKKIGSAVRIGRCMADSKNSICILPNGELTSCEHIGEGPGNWGDIYNGCTKPDVRREWARHKGRQELCSDCPYYPSCVIPANCPLHQKDCSEGKKEIHKIDILRSMKYEYTLFCENGIDNEENKE